MSNKTGKGKLVNHSSICHVMKSSLTRSVTFCYCFGSLLVLFITMLLSKSGNRQADIKTDIQGSSHNDRCLDIKADVETGRQDDK